jgi:hypothetical protein
MFKTKVTYYDPMGRVKAVKEFDPSYEDKEEMGRESLEHTAWFRDQIGLKEGEGNDRFNYRGNDPAKGKRSRKGRN